MSELTEDIKELLEEYLELIEDEENSELRLRINAYVFDMMTMLDAYDAYKNGEFTLEEFYNWTSGEYIDDNVEGP